MTTAQMSYLDANFAAVLPLTGGTVTGNTSFTGSLSVSGATTLSTLSFTGLLTANGGLTIPRNPSVSTSPIGNPTGGSILTTFSSLVAEVATVNTSNREFAVNIGLTSSLGTGVANNNGDKVALYVGATGNAGTGDLWAFNPLLAQEPGSGTYNAQVIEVDLNNFNADRAGTDGSGGLPAKVANGVSISGTNTGGFRNTSGLAIDSFGNPPSNNQPLFSRGLTLSGYYTFSAVCDYSISPQSYEMWGVYTNGLNAAFGSFSGSLIIGPNNCNLVSALTSGATTAVILNMGSSNNVELCATNVAGCFVGPDFAPITDNSVSCGTSANRWTSVWAVNGAIQTSDATLKTNIRPVPTALPIVNDINPVTFQWKTGSNLVTVDSGQRAVNPAPGARTHWGFLASDVKTAVEKTGMDFGGYVKGEDGTEGLRPDQLLAVLWKAVQELSIEVRAMKAPSP